MRWYCECKISNANPQQTSNVKDNTIKLLRFKLLRCSAYAKMPFSILLEYCHHKRQSALCIINIQTKKQAKVWRTRSEVIRTGVEMFTLSLPHTRSYKAAAEQGLSKLVITHPSPPRCGGQIGCLQQRCKRVTLVLTVSLEHSDYAKWIDARVRHLGRETEEILPTWLLTRRDDAGRVRGWKRKVGCTKKLIIKFLIQLIFSEQQNTSRFTRRQSRAARRRSVLWTALIELNWDTI